MKKGKQFVLTLLVCLVSFAFPAFAGQQKVFDYADLLTSDEEAQLQQMAEAMVQDWDMDLAFLTTFDTEGMPVREYGANFYIEQDLGVGSDYDGVIFVVDMTSREAQIVTSGKAIDIFTDYYLEKMWNNMQGDFADGYYFWGMETLVTDMNHYNAEYQKYLTDPDYVSEYAAEEEDVTLFLMGVAFIFSLIVAAISVAVMKSKSKNVRPYSAGEAYLKQNGFYLSTDKDIFANTRTTMAPIPRDNDSDKGSWGGGSSTFNSDGRSFGSGGGGF